MIYGGIYDQLGGGFARYSTDAEWLAPHFEKMLYDNALLIIAYERCLPQTHNSHVMRKPSGKPLNLWKGNFCPKRVVFILPWMQTVKVKKGKYLHMAKK